MTSKSRKLLGRILITILTINGLAVFPPVMMSVSAQQNQQGDHQNRVIVINAEQPNIWTLEQAHYLLAQMHRRNLDLKAKNLEELDPNEIAGLRFDVMRMLVEFGATFNQADLETNRLLSDNRTFNSERRQKLMDDRSRLSDESVRLSSEIKDLELEKADTEDADQKKRLDAKIAATTSHQARVDKQIETIDAELKTLNAPSGTPTATTGGATFDANKLPKSTFDKAFEEAAAKQISKFSDSPKLNASLRLDNFLQMQYEIISKQLSLLRDELGPGERLVFLELPQTVNAAHHESDKKWAQSWWKIAGYTRRERTSALPALPLPRPLPPDAPRQQPIKTTQDIDSIIYGAGIPVPVATPCTSRPASFINTEAIRVSDTPASPKPEPLVINVPDLKGARVTKVTVTLNGLRHPNPDNLDLMLVGPQGQNAVIMSDVGGTNAADDLTITLDDTAPAILPDAGPLVNGTYKPTNVVDGSVDSVGTPAPLGGSALSIFNGTNPKGAWKLYVMDDSGVAAGSIGGGWGLSFTTTDCSPPPSLPTQVEYKDVFFNLDNPPAAWPAGVMPPHMPVGSSMLSTYLSADNRRLENRVVRTVDLIPRQSSLNVSDMKLRTRAGAFNFVLSTLFGFGSQLNVQRQREQFSQFVQQELYSAAFGKGAREFGWTFTPMPGTDRLMSGVRTTYAVVVVPEDATSLVLESNGCYFPRSNYPPNNFDDTKSEEWNKVSRTSRNCGGGNSSENPTKVFVVPIPSARAEGGNEFWVDKVTFQPVAKGKRVVVEIRGKNFSPQTGVLINGVPLIQSIGLAQPLIRDDSAAGRATIAEFKDAEVQGQVERVNTEKIIFSFKMPPDFKGTPTITLIAPGRATDINDLPLQINDDHDTKLEDYTPKMIGNEPEAAAFRIDSVRVTRNRATNRLTARVNGAGFVNTSATPLQANSSDTVAQVLVNGSDNVTPTFRSPSLLTVEFDVPTDETIKVTLVSTKNNDAKEVQTIESDAVGNPAFLSVTDVEVTTYETDAEGEPATLLVKIKGTGFTDSLQALIDEKTLQVAVKSATEAVFTMPDPKAAAIVTLQDGSGQRAKIVVTRKTKRQ
jgi:subtilisin-like proprotein convertase family protein